MFDRKQSFLRKAFVVLVIAAAGTKKMQVKGFRKKKRTRQWQSNTDSFHFVTPKV
jgi:hypothetical protein